MNHSFDPHQTAQCQRYLLDALSADERESFESQWESSPELLDCLAVQAALIADLGEALTEESSTMVVNVVSNHAELGSFQTAEFAGGGHMLAGLAGLAAMILFVFWSGGRVETSPTIGVSSAKAEQIEIARVWALYRSTSVLDVAESSGEMPVVEVDIEVFDEPPSWLALGVAEAYRDDDASLIQEVSDDAT
ncbi:MAG: hypothetical protein R3C05_32005 [Pirellulaceae bacterium]